MTPTLTPPAADKALSLLDPADAPDLDLLVTEDDTPVDNLYVEKLQRLLTEPLYSSWPGPGDNRTFLALANVGLFYSTIKPPIVPDMMLSLDVPAELYPRSKEHRSYFTWIMGKVPDLALEVVSDLRGEEEGEKMRTYARLNIPLYVIYDPLEHLGHGILRAFAQNRKRYVSISPTALDDLGLGLTLWEGEYEGQHETWLRWCDAKGQLIATGKEQAAAERRRADQQEHRAEQLEHRAEQLVHRAETAEARIARLEAQLRESGLQPRNGE